MASEQPALILEQRVSKHADSELHCHEVSLRLSNDRHHLILSHYTEHYSPQGSQWVEQHHQVPMNEVLHWFAQQAGHNA
ncbi:hypothetical protein [Pseudomonas batumici]|uniref:Uncharacterized protein n=1 Tax=Pseudomonas batumici TaxID=226910 RepID=A0A0C2ETD6_9PSED|nr:hypothetical protein [Pseudomonas batumici]KIH81798.1 hypothetical protein UCMB321_4461 [Pseudomonas batumici]